MKTLMGSDIPPFETGDRFGHCKRTSRFICSERIDINLFYVTVRGKIAEDSEHQCFFSTSVRSNVPTADILLLIQQVLEEV